MQIDIDIQWCRHELQIEMWPMRTDSSNFVSPDTRVVNCVPAAWPQSYACYVYIFIYIYIFFLYPYISIYLCKCTHLQSPNRLAGLCHSHVYGRFTAELRDKFTLQGLNNTAHEPSSIDGALGNMGMEGIFRRATECNKLDKLSCVAVVVRWTLACVNRFRWLTDHAHDCWCA